MLGKLAISQALIGSDNGKTFDMEVTLDGEKLPVGTVYSVDGRERTVTEAGIVTLRNGETAIIGNILSGTGFEVRQVGSRRYRCHYRNPGRHRMDGQSELCQRLYRHNPGGRCEHGGQICLRHTGHRRYGGALYQHADLRSARDRRYRYFSVYNGGLGADALQRCLPVV